jgi:hypothetical protein
MFQWKLPGEVAEWLQDNEDIGYLDGKTGFASFRENLVTMLVVTVTSVLSLLKSII